MFLSILTLGTAWTWKSYCKYVFRNHISKAHTPASAKLENEFVKIDVFTPVVFPKISTSDESMSLVESDSLIEPRSCIQPNFGLVPHFPLTFALGLIRSEENHISH